jgi:3-deoxy-7-phosphoheptulonate synthase
MKFNTDDLRITGMAEVLPPEELLQELPLSDEASTLVFNVRNQVSEIVAGRDKRLLVIAGPCSIHDPAAALDYAARLQAQAEQYADQLCVLMRVYFEKPRTTVGWKGLINDPHLDNSYDINQGLRTARSVLRDITELGIGAGTEYLDPITPQYIGDVVAWGAIGARTTESQIHRQLASGLSCPIGFKNSTYGDVQVAADAVMSAQHPHIFLSVMKTGKSAIFSTSGNQDCHVILRGGKTPNFDAASVQQATKLLADAKLNDRLMVDMSHANSAKDHMRQIDVCSDLSQQIAAGEERIMGVMIESHLVAGKQSLGPDLTYGQSITDACIGWDDTVKCLEQLADAVTKRAS